MQRPGRWAANHFRPALQRFRSTSPRVRQATISSASRDRCPCRVPQAPRQGRTSTSCRPSTDAGSFACREEHVKEGTGNPRTGKGREGTRFALCPPSHRGGRASQVKPSARVGVSSGGGGFISIGFRKLLIAKELIDADRRDFWQNIVKEGLVRKIL